MCMEGGVSRVYLRMCGCNLCPGVVRAIFKILHMKFSTETCESVRVFVRVPVCVCVCLSVCVCVRVRVYMWK